MKVIKVEPMKKAYVKEIDPGLKSLQTEVDGYIQAIYPFKDNVGIVCNEDAKLIGMELNRALYLDGEICDIIAGPFLVVGLTEDDFGSLPDDLVKKYLKVFKEPEIFLRVNGNIVAMKV
jgi:hypothetical protein